MIECLPSAERYCGFRDLQYRKTPLFGRFLAFKLVRDGGWTVH